MDITPPKWDEPLISQKSQFRYIQEAIKAQHKNTCTWCANHHIGEHNIYKHMQGTKTNTCKGRVTFNVNKLSTCYRKEEHWIYDKNMIIQMTWLEQV